MILPYIGYKTETSCNAGTIKLQRKEFFLGLDGQISTGETLVSLLELVEGKELDVYWLDDSEGNVMKALVYLRGAQNIVCEAILKPKFHRAKIEQTAADRENMKLVMSYIQTFSGFISRRKAEIEKVMVIDRRTSVVNNKFVIPGLEPSKHYEADDETEVLDDTPQQEEPDTVDTLPPESEVLYDDTETDFENNIKPIKTGVKQRLLNQLTSNY